MWLGTALPQTPPAAPPAGKTVPTPSFESSWSLTLDLKDPLLAASATTVFIAATSGTLTAYALDDGRELWKSDARPIVPPVEGDELLFVVEEHAVVALSQATGEQKWTTPLTPLHVRPLHESGWLFLADSEGSVVALRSSDGSQVWRQAVGAPLVAPMTLDGDLLFAPLLDGRLVALVVSAEGKLKWTCVLDSAGGTPVAAGERVYIGSAKGLFYSVKQKDGRVDWRHTRMANTVIGHPILSGPRVLIATMEKRVVAFNRGSGAQLWGAPFDATPAEQIAVDGESLFVPEASGEIAAVAEKTGKSVVAIPAPKSTGSRLAAPIVVAGPPGGMRLVRLMLGSDGMLTLEIFKKAAPPSRPALPARPRPDA